MSEFINENPDVLEESQLPTRSKDELDVLFENEVQKAGLERKRNLLKIVRSIPSKTFQDVEAMDRLMTIERQNKQVNDLKMKALSLDQKHEEDEEIDPLDPQEIYDLIAHISDPEHPLSLGQLAVVNLADIEVHENDNKTGISEVIVKITPTITHCSLATLLGLGIRVRLDRCLPPRYRKTILLKEGSHQSENQVNKQLNDKERVAAACENDQLLGVVSKMLSTCK
ncbi:LAMI_0B01706g1_1 [Lachancea mirantina]|uniref:LAMI_0B01706g1_1 n=1 Tax=Lachancea mirantina TaxID=1230905 RepID=A0A1G4ITT5_9SACH|nr:LAMI_0B01706g1_1 [Lachancea mirantina]